MDKIKKIKFIDTRPIRIPKLEKYPNGIHLPSDTNIIEVTEEEASSLLKRKNGKNKKCFELVMEKRKENTGGEL